MKNAAMVTAVGICGVMMLAQAGYAGPKWDISEDSWMKLSFLGQLHYKYEDKAVDVDDFYARRARIILAGQVKDGVQFFAETDNANGGKYGAGNPSTAIQDAFADFRLIKKESGEAWVAGGLILLPFSFENKSSAASILGIDYNSEAIKLVNSYAWRDIGAELHGNVGKKFSCRVGAFDGYDTYSTSTIEKNPAAKLRYTGHVAVNLLGEAETGSFYTQERLATGHYVSLGAGYDTQSKATRTIPTLEKQTVTEKSADAWVLDVQSGFELPCGTTITLNGAYFDWNNGSFDGNTAFVETGVKHWNAEATGKITLVDPSASEETTDYAIGMNYFFSKHGARAGVEYRWGDSSDQVLGGIQILL